MILEDSRGREFGSDPDAYEFMPPDLMEFDNGTGITTCA
jgi:hypothetical protein